MRGRAMKLRILAALTLALTKEVGPLREFAKAKTLY
jgi:hypothetical protein